MYCRYNQGSYVCNCYSFTYSLTSTTAGSRNTQQEHNRQYIPLHTYTPTVGYCEELCMWYNGVASHAAKTADIHLHWS